MKNKKLVFATMFAFGLLIVSNLSAQRSPDYTYQNQNGRDNTYRNQNGTRYENSNTYDRRDQRYQYQNRAYYATSNELQRLYQIEDALRRRLESDIALGYRRDERIDREKLQDVQEHIAKEERRFAFAHRNDRNFRDRRYENDHDGRR